MKLIIDIPDTNYQWIKEHNKGIILPITRHLYEGVRKGIPLEDFLEQRKEPIDKSVIEAYLKENKTIVLTDKQFDKFKMLSTKNDFTDELRTIIKCDDFFEGENKQ